MQNHFPLPTRLQFTWHFHRCDHVPAELFLRTRRATQFTGATHRRENRSRRRGDYEKSSLFPSLGGPVYPVFVSLIVDRKFAIRSLTIRFAATRSIDESSISWFAIKQSLVTRAGEICLFSTSQRYLTFTPRSSFYNLPRFNNIGDKSPLLFPSKILGIASPAFSWNETRPSVGLISMVYLRAASSERKSNL